MRNNSVLKKYKMIAVLSTVLLMTAAALIACLPASANVLPTGTIQTSAYLSLRHNPTGLNQEVLVNSWVVPNAPRWADLGLTPPTNPSDPLWIPGTSSTSGIPRLGYTYTITKPGGQVQTVVRTSDGPSSDWFTFVPDQLGTWQVEFSWAGVTLTFANGSTVTFTSCTTGKIPLVVQEAQIPYYPVAELPTDFWNYPINSEMREWYRISGPYLEPTTGTARGYDSSGSRFNPYSRAPNTAHIAWMDPPAIGMAGLIGGQFNQIPQWGATAGTINVVMAGKAYYTAGNQIYCLDVRSGQRLWTVPGTYLFGMIEGSAAPATGSGTGLFNGQPTLVFVGNNPNNASQLNLIKWDGHTGAVKLNITMPISGTLVYFGNDYTNAYVHRRPTNVDTFSTTGPFYLIKLNLYGTSTNLSSRIVYEVPYNFMAQDVGICIYGDILANVHYPEYGPCGAVNTTTGAQLWSRYINGIEQKAEAVTSSNGVMFCSLNDRHFMAIDMKTGVQKWSSQQTEFPWGNFWAYGEATGYGKVYGLSYAGVYAFDDTNGNILWHYGSGDSGEETPYGTWPFGSIDPIIADNKVFAPTSEHSPTLYYRGQRLHVIDVNSGKAVWTLMGYYTVQAVAEDTLFATNAYDGNKYAFARGNTSTTVATDLTRLSQGQSTWITGTIMDMSPAQPNTPCVSKDSMSGWMEYLHMQQPCPTNITGVPVTLSALKSDGTSVTIGTAMSNAYGIYSFKWTPPSEDAYTVIAKFAGDDSYFSSNAVTTVTVGPTASAQPTTTPSPSTSVSPSTEPTVAPTSPGTFAGSDLYIIVAAAVIVIVVLAVAVVILRRRK